MAATDLDTLSQQYARAVYQSTTEGWLDDVRRAKDQLSATPGVLDALGDAGRPLTERWAQLDTLLPQDLRADVRNFLHVLLKDGHLGLLESVIAELSRFVTHGPGSFVARVVSAVPLTAEEQETLRQRIRSAYGERVDVEFRVDAAILGGAIVQVGDKVIDGSIAGKLNALHERLIMAR
jgi:F-type H+-transporting ATPase subunit delta